MLRTLEFFSLLWGIGALICDETLCPPEWVSSTQRGDSFCDLDCMNDPCGYDGGAGSFSASDCRRESCESWYFGDGICSTANSKAICGWDMGECGYCAEGCRLHAGFQESLSNGICEEQCNTATCGFDGGDCVRVIQGDCASGCFASMLGNGSCEAECLTASCLGDDGDCELCAPGCYPQMLGNSQCDDACDVVECSNDSGDCDCSPGCVLDLLSNEECDEVCAFASCGFDSHLCVTCTQGDCEVGCFQRMVGDGHCDLACNSAACGWDGLDCVCAPGCDFADIGTCKRECLLTQCDYGLEVAQLRTLSCADAFYSSYNDIDGYYQSSPCYESVTPVRMNCCEGCCGWMRPSEFNPEVCVLVPDTSSASAPQVFYVSPAAPPEADGSVSNPCTLRSAFQRLYQAFTTFLLLPGEHDILSMSSFVQKMLPGGVYLPTPYTEKLVIIPRDCVAGGDNCVRVTLKYIEEETSFYIQNIASVEISYVDLYSTVQPLTCMFCISYLALFSVANNKLALSHVAFRHFNGVLNTVLRVDGGKVELIDVDFEDITGNPNFSTGVIYLNPRAKLSYIGGTVTLLNNGQRYGSTMQIFNFLTSDLATLAVKNVTFSHNLAEVSTMLSSQTGLIMLGVCRQCLFSHCVFRNNIAMSIVRYQGDVYEKFSPYIRTLAANSIEISDCEFANNTAAIGTLTFFGTMSLPDIVIRNCTFTNELSASYGVVAIQASRNALRRVKIWKLFEENDRQVNLTFSVASAILTNLRFINCTVTEYGVIAIVEFPQVLVSDVEIDSGGAFRGANRYSNTLRDFENFGGSIPDNIPPMPTANCTSLLNFTSVYNLTISALRSNAANCTLRLQASGDSMTMRSSTFSSFNPSEEALLRLQFSSVSVISTAFEEIQCAGGSVQVATGRLHLAASHFLEVKKAVVVQRADSVVVEHSEFVGGQGAALAFYLATWGVRLEVRNCTFDRNAAAGDNGIIAMLADQYSVQVALLLTESRFTNNQVPLSSSLLFLRQLTFADESEVSSCEFSNNTVGTLYFASIAGSLRIADCVFTNNTGETIFCECSQPCSVDLSALSFSSNIGVAVALRNSTAVAAKLHFRANEGVCLDLTSSQVSASELSFTKNSAEEGPALTLSASRAALTHSTFHFNSAKSNGGAVLVQAGSEFNCSFCIFEGLTATLGGAVFVKYESVVHLSNSRFVGNTAWDGFAILLALSKQPSFIGNSVFEGNSGVGSGVISLMNAALVLSSSVIRNNTSSSYSAGLVLQLASVTMSHCEFSNQRSASGCFVYASHSEVRAEHSLFSAGSATAYGGAILISATNLTAENCTFSGLTAATGAALAIQSSSSTALKDCHLTDTVTQSPDRGVIEVSESLLHLFDVHFKQFTGSAIVGEAAILAVAFSEFADNEMTSTGGGIACEACSSVTIASSLFTRLKADIGSAVYLHSEVDSSTSHWEISGCVFSANTANAAATVWLKGTRTVVSHSLFSENTAGNFGGGLALFELFSEVKNNSFASNRANEGAGIYWRGIQPNITDIECIGNVAEYGDCFSSFAVALKVEKNSTLSGLPSGQVGWGGISILLVDHYGQAMSSDSSSDGWLMSGRNDTAVSGVTHSRAQRGRFLFNDFVVTAQPKSNASLLVYSSVLNSSYRLEVEMRDCVRGEMLRDSQCGVCEAGTYSLDPSEPCKKCPSEAVCLGNFTLTPRPGYWRQSEYTDYFFQCPNKDSCLGSPGPTTNLTGQCEEGYEGNKCQSCSIGYYRWGKVSCAKCPSAGVQVAVRLSIIAFASLLAILIVRSSLKEHGIHSAYTKVFMNYLQLVMLLGSFHLQWPSIMLRLFNAQESVGAFLEIAFSLRCLWIDETESETYFHELIMFSLFPPFLVVVSCCVWLLISLCKKGILGFRSNVLGSAVVLYFLAYPSVIRVMASAWTLEEVGAGELWVAGLQQRALTGLHLKYAVALALPCGLLYGVLLPLAFAVKLKRNAKAQKLYLGFFTQAYRPQMYYWRFVTVLRVALVVVCISLFSRVSAAYQVLSALAVLSVSLLLHHTCRPFANNTFNVLEFRALVIVIMTLYAGLFFYAAELSTVAEIAFSAFMIAINVYFSITCWRYSALTLLSTAAKGISQWVKSR